MKPDVNNVNVNVNTKDGLEDVTLMYSRLERLPVKDFVSEVRPSMDIAQFLGTASLILDLEENTLEGVADALLAKLLVDEPDTTLEEAKSILFTHDNSTPQEKDNIDVHLLSRTIQEAAISDHGNFDYDQSWLCALANLPALVKRHVGIARLKSPANMGHSSTQIKLFVLVLCPSKEKGTKNSLETGRTFSTIFSDIDFRQSLLEATTEEEFKKLIIKQSQDLAEKQLKANENCEQLNHEPESGAEYEQRCSFARGFREDLSRRLPFYISDFKDGIFGHKSLQKTISTTFFLYFACILPAIAFGVLNDHNTEGKIDVKRVIIGQVIGGIFWGLFSGQPLLIQLTTAPLAIYIKVIAEISKENDIDFYAMYCAIGLWNSFFLIIYSLFDVSKLMKWSTRSTEEIFGLFITIAFIHDAFKDVGKNFNKNYYNEACAAKGAAYNTVKELASNINASDGEYDPLHPIPTISVPLEDECLKENSLLIVLLMFGTLWLGLFLFNFNKTPYLNANKREILADYALPVAVIVLSFIGSYIFRDIHLKSQIANVSLEGLDKVFQLAPLGSLSWGAVAASCGLGFSLSLLFFMDQNICAAMVNNPSNKLKKGSAYHMDLFVVALMNGFMSIFGLPWMHACLPHSPLHVRSLADVEERVDQGHVHEIIVKVRETRLTGLFSNILIGLSLFLLPYPLAYVPTAVLDGLFLYMAITALGGNQMYERFTLIFTEQAAYPPNHYIRRVPQRSIHKFTLLQIIQLLGMCALGFSPVAYMKMLFPVYLFCLLPIRHKIIPKLIEAKYLNPLDGNH